MKLFVLHYLLCIVTNNFVLFCYNCFQWDFTY